MKIVGIGGSLIAPNGGFNIEFLQKFKDLVIQEVEQGSTFLFIIGGGVTARKYQQGLKDVNGCSDEDLDWMGIHATKLNAQFVKIMFGEYAHDEIISSPKNKVDTDKPIIVASGWKPGWSTDNVAVLMAETYGADEIINLSNIEHVYDKDPSQYDDAKPIDSISWSKFREEIIDSKWRPGTNSPFDPVASKKAQDMNLEVSILDGTNLKEVKNVLKGREFVGTVIS